MIRVSCALLAAGLLVSQGPTAFARTEVQARSGTAALRFHHVHVNVMDPASAMNALAARVDATRVILQGLGVGVRSGDQYVLFDRADDDVPAQAGAAERYRRAVAWLTGRGAAVEPPEFEHSAFGATEIPGAVGHIAFSAADLGSTITALSAAGAAPVRRTDDAALFSIGNGEIIEVVRETDRPDAFWCPMHLDIRSSAGGTCAICGMDLVPIPPPRLGEYRLDVESVVSRAARGRRLRITGLRLRVSDPDGRRVTRFATVHERDFHLFIIGRSLDYFAHVHPEPAAEEGRFDLEHALPPGDYMLLADFLPYGGTTQMLQRAIVTPGYTGRLFEAAPRLVEGPVETIVDGLRIRIVEADLAAGKSGCLQFALSDASSGTPVTDLEPFLGAPAHLLIVKPDLTDAIHGHPEEQATGGPTVSFDPRMPAPGLYKLWVQFQRKGKVTTAAFVVAAR